MKRLKKKSTTFILRVMDWAFSILAVPCAWLLLKYRYTGSARLPRTTRTLKRIGLFPIRNHYYEPLFDDSLLRKPLSEDRPLPAVDLNVVGQIKFLDKLQYSSELTAMNLAQESDDPKKFCINNGNFQAGDADFLYQFIRAVKPKRIVEIGSGHSTRIARLALLKNLSETGVSAEHICVEPYEMKWLEELKEITVIRKPVEVCDLDWRTTLSDGDLLFVDSSHMIRPQGDVLTEYLEIFPLLSSGVYIHIHDIFTPKDYMQSWVVDLVRFWNEQYLLEALLSNTDRYEIVGALNYLKHHHYEALSRACPYLSPEWEPASFYMMVR